MGRIYYVPANFTLLNSGGDTDLVELLPTDDKPITLRALFLAQTDQTQDAEERNLPLQIRTATATITSGSGGSAITPVHSKRVRTAAGFTAEVNNSTIATTTGAFTVVFDTAWNVRQSPVDLFKEYDKEWCIDAAQGEGIFLYLPSASGVDIAMRLTAVVEEDG